jgi:hypothetical protein
VFLFLVTGQGVNISLNLIEYNGDVVYLDNYISSNGHLLASVSVFSILMLLIFLENFTKKISKREKLIPKRYKQINGSRFSFSLKVPINANSIVYYSINFIITSTLIFVLFNLVGIKSVLDDSRPSASGATMLLMLLKISSYPLIFKLAFNKKILLIDVILFIATTGVSFLFTRIFTIFQMLILFLVWLYKKNIFEGKAIKEYKTRVIFFSVFLFLFFILLGAARDVQERANVSIADISELIIFAWENYETSTLSIDMLYHIGIEGMSGLSGVMTEFSINNTIRIDFGGSLLSTVFQLIPSFFRTPFEEIQKGLLDLYWYHGSVLAGGLECSFVHFSFLGIFLYPFGLLFHTQIHYKVMKFWNKGATSKAVLWIIIGVNGLLFIRGNSMAYLFFVIVNIVVFYISLLLYKFFFK